MNNLTLFEYGFMTVGREKLLCRIKDSVARGERVYLIVPEQQTVLAEAECSTLLPPQAALKLEATNFTRFADTVFRTLGGIAGEYHGGVTPSLLMWRALSEIAPMLSMTGESNQVTPGVVSRAMAAFKDAECHGISPEDLLLAKDKIKADPRLSAKLSDLALIYSTYKELTKDGYDLTDALYAARDKISDNPDFLSGARIFIDGFTSFTSPQYALISQLMSLCPVTVTLTLPRVMADSFEFAEIRDTKQRLKRAATSLSVPVFDERIAEADRDSSPLISEAVKLLFRTEGKIDNDYLQNTQDIRIFEASVPFDECDFVAADIKRRVMEGASYSDFAIIARDAEAYNGILDTSLDLAGIPHFTSSHLDVCSSEAVKLIRIAYDIFNYGIRAEWLIGYAKCGVSGVSVQDCNALEGYVSRWRPDQRTLNDPAPWVMSPRGYEEITEEDRLLLERINRAKEIALSPIREFSTRVKGAGTVRQHATCLYELLLHLDMERALKDRSRELRAIGKAEEAERGDRLFKIICTALDTLVSTLGDTSADGVSFISLFLTVLSATTVGRIPTHVDEVTVGSADMLRISGKSHVYLIGVNEGVFPATVKDSSYFTEADKARLISAGLDFEPELERQAARELFSFARAFASASKSVTVLYPTRSSAFAPLRPSSVIERLGVISNGLITPTRISALPITDRVYSPEAAALSLGEAGADADSLTLALQSAGRDDLLRVADGELANDKIQLGDEALGMLYHSDIYLSQSRIDAFLRCPMLYFSRYNLKLSEDGVAELDSRVIGTFIHSMLENFFRSLRDGHIKPGELGEEEKRKLTRESVDSYLKSSLGEGDARRDVTLSRLCRAAEPIIDGLCEEFASCKFEPVFFELTTDDRNPSAPNTVKIDADDGSRIIISGTMDRLDSFKSGDDVYVRVVDYKTGTKEFDPRKLAEGENLQMFLYLKSVTETDTPEFRQVLGVGDKGRIIPAGVIYVKTKLDDAIIPKSDDKAATEAAKKLQSREGMILDDRVSLDAQNPDFLPVRIKDGAIVETPIKRYYSPEGWAEVDATVTEAVRSIAKRIKGGDISVKREDVVGFTSPCSSCKFRPLCRNGY